MVQRWQCRIISYYNRNFIGFIHKKKKEHKNEKKITEAFIQDRGSLADDKGLNTTGNDLQNS